jgi:hypothetical protein
MESEFYLPILKAKFGEFTALSKLTPAIRKHVVPLLVIQPNEYDHQSQIKPPTMEEHLIKIGSKFKEFWPFDDTFVDTDLVCNESADGLTCIEYLYKRLFEKGVAPVPVLSLISPDSLKAGVRSVQQKYTIDSCAFRITMNDLSSATLNDRINLLIVNQLAEVENIHLILDLAAAEFDELDDFADAIVSRLEHFPYWKKWKSFSICGSAFPKTGAIKEEVNNIPRNEWKLFQLIKEKLDREKFKRQINYGDYSIVAPGYIEFDPIRMGSTANIRYTIDDDYIVLKGKSLKSKGYSQYISQAIDITNADYFLGAGYSAGDAHLKECADKQIKTGTPTIWNWVGNNHHITKVVMDLFAKPYVASYIEE